MNEAAYDRIASQWDAARQAFVGRERDYVAALLEGLPVPSSVVDVGCGTGRPMAQFVIEAGHRITGIDQSSSLLELARARFPRHRWIRAHIQAYAFDEQYDAAICWDTLFHIERAHHHPILTRLHGCLRRGGRLMLTAGGSDNPAFTDSMFGQEFFYDSLPPEQLSSLLVAIGFDLRLNEYMDLPTSGRNKGRVAIVARKADVHLEPATPDDAAAFAAMEHDGDASRFVSANTTEEHVMRMADPRHVYLRIMRDGHLVGFFLLVLDSDATSVEFRRVVVSSRDGGVGQAALRQMERFCQAVLGRSRIWLDVYEDNHRARHIYQKLGFVRFGETSKGDRRMFLYEKTVAFDLRPSTR